MESALNFNELGRCYILNDKALVWVNVRYIKALNFFTETFQINRNECSIDFQDSKLSVKIQDNVDEETFSKLFDFPITESIGSTVSISLNPDDRTAIVNELNRVKDELVIKINFYEENV